MSFERQSNSEETLVTFRGCLVEGDPEQRKRERRIRRRALAISIALQSAAVAAVLLVPLFGKTERLVLAKDFIPLPPYHHNSGPARQNSSTTPRRPSSNFTLCLTCLYTRVRRKGQSRVKRPRMWMLWGGAIPPALREIVRAASTCPVQ
jgi:hypothetical protein